MAWLEENVLPRVYAELRRFKTADAVLLNDVETALNVPERERVNYVDPATLVEPQPESTAVDEEAPIE